MYCFHTEYCYRSLGKHSRNLAISLHEQLHFAVFLQWCFVNSAPTHTDFQSFPGWETGYFPAMALLALESGAAVTIGPRWTSLVPRLLSAEGENSLVNCLYRLVPIFWNHHDITSAGLWIQKRSSNSKLRDGLLVLLIEWPSLYTAPRVVPFH